MKLAKISTTDLAYIEKGSGLPVVLVHGFPLDHSMWDAQIDALASAYRVIAPDVRGFGRSPLGNVDDEAGISMEQFADELNEFVDVIGVSDPFVMAGFSMGGYIAWQFVRKYGAR